MIMEERRGSCHIVCGLQVGSPLQLLYKGMLGDIHKYIYTHIYAYIYIYIYTYTYTYMYIEICAYLRIHIYIYKHTYMHRVLANQMGESLEMTWKGGLYNNDARRHPQVSNSQGIRTSKVNLQV